MKSKGISRLENILKESVNDKKFLRRFASKFFLSNGILYKRSHDCVLLRCMDKDEAELIMTDIHSGTFGTHLSGHTMAKKIPRAGYYWSTIEGDCHQHSRTCHKCQVYADKIHILPVPLNVLTAPWPFAMWGIDMIGEIKPTTSNGHRFILVVIDYFTKWVEAASFASVIKNVDARFIKQNLICRYGIPERIIVTPQFYPKQLCKINQSYKISFIQTNRDVTNSSNKFIAFIMDI